MSAKSARQKLLASLLQEYDVRSQAEARTVLAASGVEATQATVSRDLDEMGAVKVRGTDGELVYRIAAAPGPAGARRRLTAILKQFVVRIDASGNLVVLRTPPAAAGPVASVIDLAELPGVLATVAGDDTVLVVATQGVTGDELAQRFTELLEEALR